MIQSPFLTKLLQVVILFNALCTNQFTLHIQCSTCCKAVAKNLQNNWKPGLKVLGEGLVELLGVEVKILGLQMMVKLRSGPCPPQILVQINFFRILGKIEAGNGFEYALCRMEIY